MNANEPRGRGRIGTADPQDSAEGKAARGRIGAEGPALDVCDSAHVAETYRLAKDDEACDDGIR